MNNEQFTQPAYQPTRQDPIYGLTGSQLQQQKASTPVGVYIIAIANLAAFVASFFDTSQTSLIYTIVMLAELLLALGLILRVNTARKVMMTLATITIVMSVASAVLLVGVQHRIATSKANYNTAISKINPKQLNVSEQAQLDQLKSSMATAEKQAGKAITYTYALLVAYSVESIAVITYLSHPRIRDFFTT
ncbi:MAG: hypothetical protein ACQR33_00715 [Candidatus Saccharibacteria bacterium]